MTFGLPRIVDAILPGALPATAGSVILAIASAAPAWLLAVGQAMIVALWCSSAVRRMNRETNDRLGTIEDAIRGLECVKTKKVAALLGTPVPRCPAAKE